MRSHPSSHNVQSARTVAYADSIVGSIKGTVIDFFASPKQILCAACEWRGNSTRLERGERAQTCISAVKILQRICVRRGTPRHTVNTPYSCSTSSRGRYKITRRHPDTVCLPKVGVVAVTRYESLHSGVFGTLRVYCSRCLTNKKKLLIDASCPTLVSAKVDGIQPRTIGQGTRQLLSCECYI